MTPKIFDISLPISSALAGWPGDAPFRLAWSCTKAAGAAVNVGQVSMSIHTGTHADAPFHFADDGPTIDRMPLDSFIGPARLIDVSGRPVISPDDIEPYDLSSTPRVLLRSNAWTAHERFPNSIPTMSPGLPQWLYDRGVVLIGLDVPSVDAIDSKDLPIHHALGRCGIAIIESLDLANVPVGVYELIALPLKLLGGDGAPVRAILRSL